MQSPARASKRAPLARALDRKVPRGHSPRPAGTPPRARQIPNPNHLQDHQGVCATARRYEARSLKVGVRWHVHEPTAGRTRQRRRCHTADTSCSSQTPAPRLASRMSKRRLTAPGDYRNGRRGTATTAAGRARRLWSGPAEQERASGFEILIASGTVTDRVSALYRRSHRLSAIGRRQRPLSGQMRLRRPRWLRVRAATRMQVSPRTRRPSRVSP